MDGENNGKTLLKWMIWGYPYFCKHPNVPTKKIHSIPQKMEDFNVIFSCEKLRDLHLQIKLRFRWSHESWGQGYGPTVTNFKLIDWLF